MAVKRFEDLDSWKLTRELTRQIYQVTRSGPFSKDYGLRDQMRRAAISIQSNIAEGFERGGQKEYIRFLGIAKGSAAELRSQLYAALDLGYLDQDAFKKLHQQAEHISGKLYRHIEYLRSFRGKV